MHKKILFLASAATTGMLGMSYRTKPETEQKLRAVQKCFEPKRKSYFECEIENLQEEPDSSSIQKWFGLTRMFNFGFPTVLAVDKEFLAFMAKLKKKGCNLEGPSDKKSLEYGGHIVVYDPVRRMPFFTVEYLTPAKMNAAPKFNTHYSRPNGPKESRLTEEETQNTEDYIHSDDYRRGRMASSVHQKTDQIYFVDTFAMTNVAPQINKELLKLTRKERPAWETLEEIVIEFGNDTEVAVVTGPVFEDDPVKILGEKTPIPSHFFKLLIVAEHESCTPDRNGLSIYCFKIPNSEKAKISKCKYEGLDKFAFDVKELQKLLDYEFIENLDEFEMVYSAPLWNYVKVVDDKDKE